MANELPCEVLCKIFDYLDSFEQLVTCKKVCKKFYLVINSFFRLKQLAITSYSHFQYSCRFFHSYEEAHGRHEIRSSQFDLSHFQTNAGQFANLRKLFIIHECLETRYLNGLGQLQNLTIKSSGFKSDRVPLRLARLQVLSIDESEIFDLIELDLPQLNRLKINLFKSYKRRLAFLHFGCIELLECSRYLDVTKKISNLKFFYCERLSCSNVDDLLAHNRKLKEIHFNGSDETYAHLKQKRTLFCPDLKLYYSGNFGLHLDETTIACCVKNLPKLAAIMPFVKFVNYNCLENNLETIPNGLIPKFVNLFQLEVTGAIRDAKKFASLLHDCGYLNKLMINAALEQNFYEKLPSICPVLKCLEINSPDSLCMDFLLSFQSLQSIIVSQEMCLKLVKQIFERIKSMKYLAFFYQQDSFTEIAYKARHTLQLTIDPFKGNFTELDEVLKFLKSEVYKKDFTHHLNPNEMFVRSAFFLN